MYVCGTIDGTQFEEQQDQGFQEKEQQQFEEGKWPLTMLVVPIMYQSSHLLILQCMCLQYDGSQLRICLVYFIHP